MNSRDIGTIMAAQLFLQLVAERGADACLARIFLHRVAFFFHVLGAHGQGYLAVLAIDGGDLGFDNVTLFQ